MKFFKNYKLMTIIFGAMVLVFGIISAITFPKKVTVPESDYQIVNAKVVNVDEKTVGTTRKQKKEYQVTVSYDGAEYKLPTTSMPRFSKDSSYDMCLYEGKIYGTVDDLNKSVTSRNASADARVSTIITFVSVILFIGYLTAFLQEKKKK